MAKNDRDHVDYKEMVSFAFQFLVVILQIIEIFYLVVYAGN